MKHREEDSKASQPAPHPGKVSRSRTVQRYQQWDLCALSRNPKLAPRREGSDGAYLAHSTVPAGLHMVFALIAGVDKAVLALGVQLHQHAQRGPL